MKPKDDAKLQAIARAAFTLVEQTGLSGLTMPAIAREAGVATGTLYVYYASKDELLTALYEQAKTATAARLMQGDDPGRPFRQRFERMWLNLLRNRLEHSAEVVFMDQFINSPWYGEASRDLSTRLFRDWMGLIESAKAQLILKNLPTPLLVSSFTGSVRETALLLGNGGLKDTPAQLALAFGVCWDGIKA